MTSGDGDSAYVSDDRRLGLVSKDLRVNDDDELQTIGPYRVIRSLGAGGMGEVFLAYDPRLDRRVAIKRIRPDAAPDARRRARFQREARLAARLSHPGIVQIFDLLTAGEIDHIVMEYVAGGSLRQLLRETGARPPAEDLAIAGMVADALADAHRREVLHRDLKSENVLLCTEEQTAPARVKIADFGVARLLVRTPQRGSDSLTGEGILVGTLRAMSPEQIQGERLDPRSDLYSLGVLLYEIFTGESPFLAADSMQTIARVLKDRQRPACELRPQIPRQLSALIDELLEKEPERRPREAAEVADRLRLLAEDSDFGGETTVEPTSSSTSAAAAGQRRQVTVMSCDLVSLGEESGFSDPETLYQVTPEFQALAGEIVERFEGHLADVLGHRLLACFGYPRAHEDDARRAVLAALEIVTRGEHLRARRADEQARELAVRVGIHTGPAVIMPGASGKEELTLGRSLDLAVAVHGLAEPNGVLVSGSTHRLIEGLFDTEALAPTPLPGFPQPLRLHRVLAAGDVHSRVDSDAVPLTRLVAREQELALLISRWQTAAGGTGQVVLVGGEAGIGKSRLVWELKRRLAVEDAGWLIGHGSPYARNSPLHPVIELLRPALTLEANLPADEQLARLEQTIERCGLPLPEVLPLLAPIFDLAWEGRYPPPRLGPEQQRPKTMEALVALLLSMAEERAMVLVVEDLHWVDPSTLELLDLLIDQAAAAPALLLLTSRPEFDAPWGHRAGLTQLELSPLTDSQVETLIGRLPEADELPAKLRQKIVAGTDGVPLFVEELTRTVVEAARSRASREDGDSSVPLVIPATLRDSLTARLDRLGAAREVAQLAATVGRKFSYSLLAAVSSLPAETLETELERLVRAGLIRRRGFSSAARYFFKHALIRETAYESLLQPTRHHWHHRIARVLEQQPAEVDAARTRSPEQELPLLAYHWSRAVDPGDPDPERVRKAVDYLRRAAEQQLQLGAFHEAGEHLREALGLISALAAGAERDELELALQMHLGTVYKVTQGWTSAEVKQAYDRARRLCGRLGDRPELPLLLFGLWSYHMCRGECRRAREMARESFEQARQADDSDLLMLAHCALSNTLFWLAELPASLTHTEAVLKLYVPEQHDAHRDHYGQDPRVFAMMSSVWCLWHLGRPRDARQRHDQLLALAAELSHPFSTAIALNTSLCFYRNQHDVPGTRRAAEQLVDLSRKLAFSQYEITGLLFRDWAEAQAADGGALVAQIRERFETYKKKVGKFSRTYMAIPTAEVCCRAGRYDEGLAVVDEGLAVAETNQELAHEAELHWLRGKLLLQRGAAQEEEPHRLAAGNQAQAALERAFELARDRRQAPFVEGIAATLSSLLEQDGRTGEAQQLRAAAQRLCEEMAEEHAVAFDSGEIAGGQNST